MGNSCMHPCFRRSSDQEHNVATTTTQYPPKQLRREVEEKISTGVIGIKKLKVSDGEGNCKDVNGKKGDREGIVRVKIVLTKEELQWLMVRLKSDGENRLENMLEEIERGRKKAARESGKGNGWKPSLESIMETPESVLEMNPSIRL